MTLSQQAAAEAENRYPFHDIQGVWAAERAAFTSGVEWADPVGFVNWLTINYFHHTADRWRLRTDDYKVFTTEQLFTIYKQFQP